MQSKNSSTLNLTYCMSGLLLLSAVSACNDDVLESQVPEPQMVRYSHNIYTIVTEGAVSNLEAPGSYVRIYERQQMTASNYLGVGGLLILHTLEDLWYAYDLACPYCYKKWRKIELVDMDNALEARCKACESVYGVVTYGNPSATKGPANEDNCILRQYRARLTGSYNIVVTK